MRRIARFVAVALLASACAGRTQASSDGGPAAEPDQEAPASPAPVETIPEDRLTDCAQLTKSDTPLIVAVDNFFAPQCAIVKAGAELRVTNEGVRPHSFTISEQVFREKPWMFDLDPIEGSAEGRGELTLEPGIYEFYCKYHLGMDGVLQVVEPIS